MQNVEQPLIVLVDGEKQCVHLYGEHTKTIPFDDIFILDVFLEGKQVYYIQELSTVDGSEVIEVVEELRDQSQEPEKRYIRCLVEDYVRIPELKLTFAGPKDCKPIEKYGYDVFEKSPTLRRYLREGRVEILTETEVFAIKKRRPDPKAKDRALDSLILQKSVEKTLENSDMFDDDKVDEITEANSAEVMTDAEATLKKHKWGKAE
jgi:hypothetical protein